MSNEEDKTKEKLILNDIEERELFDLELCLSSESLPIQLYNHAIGSFSPKNKILERLKKNFSDSRPFDASKLILKLCDNNGRFDYLGIKGTVSKVGYGYFGYWITFEQYDQLGRPDNIKIERTDTLTPALGRKDEGRFGVNTSENDKRQTR